MTSNMNLDRSSIKNKKKKRQIASQNQAFGEVYNSLLLPNEQISNQLQSATLAESLIDEL